jgi:hypothetical protein
MTEAHAAVWWSESLSTFVKYHIDMAKVERDFMQYASIRPGVKELFDFE